MIKLSKPPSSFSTVCSVLATATALCTLRHEARLLVLPLLVESFVLLPMPQMPPMLPASPSLSSSSPIQIQDHAKNVLLLPSTTVKRHIMSSLPGDDYGETEAASNNNEFSRSKKNNDDINGIENKNSSSKRSGYSSSNSSSRDVQQVQSRLESSLSNLFSISDGRKGRGGGRRRNLANADLPPASTIDFDEMDKYGNGINANMNMNMNMDINSAGDNLLEQQKILQEQQQKLLMQQQQQQQKQQVSNDFDDPVGSVDNRRLVVDDDEYLIKKTKQQIMQELMKIKQYSNPPIPQEYFNNENSVSSNNSSNSNSIRGQSRREKNNNAKNNYGIYDNGGIIDDEHLYQALSIDNANQNKIDPQVLHEQVFENEQGFLSQSKIFRESLSSSSSSSSSISLSLKDGETLKDALQKEAEQRRKKQEAAKHRRSTLYRKEQSKHLEKIQQQMKIMEQTALSRKEIEALAAETAATGKNNNNHSTNDSTTHNNLIVLCSKCDVLLTREEIMTEKERGIRKQHNEMICRSCQVKSMQAKHGSPYLMGRENNFNNKSSYRDYNSNYYGDGGNVYANGRFVSNSDSNGYKGGYGKSDNQQSSYSKDNQKYQNYNSNVQRQQPKLQQKGQLQQRQRQQQQQQQSINKATTNFSTNGQSIDIGKSGARASQTVPPGERPLQIAKKENNDASKKIILNSKTQMMNNIDTIESSVINTPSKASTSTDDGATLNENAKSINNTIGYPRTNNQNLSSMKSTTYKNVAPSERPYTSSTSLNEKIPHQYSHRIMELQKQKSVIDPIVWRAQYKAAMHRYNGIEETGTASMRSPPSSPSEYNDSLYPNTAAIDQNTSRDYKVTELLNEIKRLKGVVNSYKGIIDTYQKKQDSLKGRQMKGGKNFQGTPKEGKGGYQPPPNSNEFDDVPF